MEITPKQPSAMNFKTHVPDSGQQGQQGQQQNQGQNQSNDSGGGTNNQGQQNANNSGGDGDNTGQNFNLDTFWDKPTGADGSDTPPSGPSNGNPNNNSGGQQQQQAQSGTPIQTFQDTLNGLPLADGILTPEIQQGLADGDGKAFNEAILANSRNTVQQSLVLSAQMINEAMARMEAKFEGQIQDSFGQDRNSRSLEDAIPSAKNPALRRVIDPIYQHALTKTGNNTEQAIEMTKSALAAMNMGIAEDVGVKLESTDSGDSGQETKVVNWADEVGLNRD